MSRLVTEAKEAVLGMIPGLARAAFLDAKGEQLRVASSEKPTAEADEIVIKNHAVAVNPIDWKIQSMGMMIKSWPVVLGCDIAGEVVHVGSNVTKFKVGDRVLSQTTYLTAQTPRSGGYAHFTAVPAAIAAILPNRISYNDGCVLPLAIGTASSGLYQEHSEGFFGLPPPTLNPPSLNKTLLVWGASSSVGAVTVQLAHASGVKTVAVASARNHALLQTLGVHAVVDYNGENVLENVLAAIQGVGGEFIGVYDTIANDATHKYTVPILAKLGGNLAVTTQPPPELPEGVKCGRVFGLNPAIYPVWDKYVAAGLDAEVLKPVPAPQIVGEGLGFVQKGLDDSKKGVSARKLVIELLAQ